MSADSFFVPGDCRDPAYENVRDLPHLEEARNLTESLWGRYQGYEDVHFLREARDHFLERFWEMYLAVTFLERGFDIFRAGNAGPEFCFASGNRKIWVEAVAPGPGTGNDRVPELQIGMEVEVASEVPTEKILLRYANAITVKRERYLAAVKSGILKESDGYVLAINSRRIPHAPYGSTLPFFIQALLPFGPLTILIDPRTRDIGDRFYRLRESVAKAEGSRVSTASFLDPQFAFVSAVLHSSVDCVNCPPTLGGEFTILHNPNASHPISDSLFSWCEQLVYRNEVLRKVHSV
jgi:hypothetical protein